MKRRDFWIGVNAVGWTLSGFHSRSTAQTEPVEGKDYVRLSQPLPMQEPGKIEVVEFFWYGCPHCNAFEPMLDAWAKKLPPDVVFRRAPVAFRAEPFGAHQRIFFALDEMNLIDAMHRKVFYAIHNERQRLDKSTDIATFMAKHGVDAPRFLDYYNGFSVQTKAHKAARLAQAYKIDGVPAIGIQGKFFTSITQAGTPARALQVADFLIQRSRVKP